MKNFVFSIFLVLTLSSCSTMEFNTNGREPFTVAAQSKSEKQVTVEATKDFYFWGMSPTKPEFNLQDETRRLGVYNPSYVTIEQSYSFSDVLYTIITLGLYCPVTYKLTLLTNGELK
ncbi:MAG: hypothetical protein H7336_11840 [Bacteriovorax sp.]|nr:hypothetical protein [Bacteriovorax sp.]